MIDLSKIEDAALREELKASIKADKEASIQKRLSKVKSDEETQLKLDKLAEYEEKELKQQKENELLEKEKVSDIYLTTNKVNVEVFKDMKKYDEFLELNSDEDREKFITELKTKKPVLFETSKKSLLDISGAEVKTDGAEKKVTVY